MDKYGKGVMVPGEILLTFGSNLIIMRTSLPTIFSFICLMMIFITSNAQNVGVGTVTPLRELDVRGTLRVERNSNSTNPHLELYETALDFARISFTNPTTSNYYTLAGMPAADSTDSRFHIFHNGYGNILSARGNGNVGIGTSNPVAALHINSRVGEDLLRVQRNNVTRFRIFDNNAMVFGANWNAPIPGVIRFETPNLFIGYDGNHVPSERLEVDGSIKVKGLFMANGAANGYYLSTDASGKASWQPLPVDNDPNPSNELQTITKSGNVVTLSNGGGSFLDDDIDADSNPTNEIQSLSLNGSTLSISNGNSVNLPISSGGTHIEDPSGNQVVDTDRIGDYVAMDVDGIESFVFDRHQGKPFLMFNNSNFNINVTSKPLVSSSTGNFNVVIGDVEQSFGISGDNNVMLGDVQSQLFSGDDNVIIGTGSGTPNRFRNVVLGKGAGQSLAGNSVVAIGESAGNGSGGLSVHVGNGAQPGGNYSQGGSFGYLAANTGSGEYVIGNIQTNQIGGYEPWSNLSDGRFKTNVKEDVPGLDFINLLRPVTYYMDNKSVEMFIRGKEEFQQLDPDYREGLENKSTKIETGFIAQEVEASAKLLNYDFDGVQKPQNEKDPYALAYAQFVVPLVKAVQELSAKVESQNLEILALKEELNLNKNLVTKE
jgi:hypothetical protein